MLANLSLLELFFELAPLSKEDANELKLVGFLKKMCSFVRGQGGRGVGCIFKNALLYLGGMPTSFSSSAFFCVCSFVEGGANELKLINHFFKCVILSRGM
jgi:hypothetical protein